jgi:uncharacterized protein YgiM (DUF1202 family)
MKSFVPLIVLILFLFASPNLAAAAPCPNAPAPRLYHGATGVVAIGVGPLNLRALPAVSTGIVAQLYSGTRMRVLAGPSCNGGYNWWRVELANGRRGWVAEGDWDRYYVLLEREADRRIDPVAASCPPLISGRPCFTR